MPIPAWNPEDLSTEVQSGLRVAEEPSVRARTGALLYPRVMAHFVDICVVQGFSLYGAKFFTILLMGAYAHAINGRGRGAGAVFRQAYAYSSAQLFAAAFASFAVVYFVGLPMSRGRTLGMGLLGLRITATTGAPPTMRQLLLRLLVCAATYASAGLLMIVGLRQHDGQFLQDSMSGTRVIRE